MRAILHIGMEKTGTTSLQAALAANRTTLEQHGFCYSRAAGEQAHIALPLYAADPGAVVDLWSWVGVEDEAALARFRRRFRRRLAVEVGRNRDACFIFSSEHCHSRLVDEASVARLHDLLSPLFDIIDVVVYLRRQDRAAVSFYFTYLRGGGAAEDILPPALSDDYLDYAAMLERWSAVFGDRITVVSYDQLDRGTVTDFFARFGLPACDEGTTTAYAFNRSIGAAAQEAMRHFNLAAPDAPGPAVERARERLIAAGLQDAAAIARRPSRGSAKHFAGRFAASNAAVEAKYNDGEPLFDDDFTEYPYVETPIRPHQVSGVFVDALIGAERAKAALAVEKNALVAENAALHASVAIAADGNGQLRAALDNALEGTRTLDALLAAERVEHRRLQAEFGYYAGLVHLDAGNVDAAHDLVARALDIDGCHAALWHLMARIHKASARDAEARAAIERAIALEPDNAGHVAMRSLITAPPEEQHGPAADGTARAPDYVAQDDPASSHTDPLTVVVQRASARNLGALLFVGMVLNSSAPLSWLP